MASILGLDLTRNTSFFTIPLAFWCAHGPHLYAAICSKGSYDNENPRDFKQNIAKKDSLDDKNKRHFLRAKCASENGYETLGLFAAAVTAANFAGVRTRTLNALSWGYIASRIVYNTIYVRFGEVPRLHHLRSLVWGSSIICSATLFVMAGLNVMNTPAIL